MIVARDSFKTNANKSAERGGEPDKAQREDLSERRLHLGNPVANSNLYYTDRMLRAENQIGCGWQSSL